MTAITFAHKIVCIGLFCALSLESGCAENNKSYSAQQRQRIETSVIEGSYDNVFNATRTVLLNEGLVLKEVQKQSGFIRAELSIKKSRITGGRIAGTIGILFLAVLTFGIALITLPFVYRSRGFDQYDITVTLVDVGNQNIEIRLQTPLLEKKSVEYGVALKRIYAEITKQTMILEAAGRV